MMDVPVQEQRALGREILLPHGVIEQEQHGVDGEKPELVRGIMVSLHRRLLPSQPFAC